ncbi:MAG TPA: cupredoxin domain-containing protein [Actinomycetota bacterium]|nr:cupredoxin domain-containing protein [Actinomycetota bacterium]
MRLGMRSLLGLVLVSLLVAACSDSHEGHDVDDGGVAAQTGAGATEGDTPGGGAFYPSTGSTGPTGTSGATGAAEDVQVSLNNFLFDPNPVEVASGDVISVRNGNTRTPHTFTVVGQDVDLELGPLETETVEIALDPGTYELICRFHEAQDMTASLVVT